jgi:hypothetical protein
LREYRVLEKSSQIIEIFEPGLIKDMKMAPFLGFSANICQNPQPKLSFIAKSNSKLMLMDSQA